MNTVTDIWKFQILQNHALVQPRILISVTAVEKCKRVLF